MCLFKVGDLVCTKDFNYYFEKGFGTSSEGYPASKNSGYLPPSKQNIHGTVVKIYADGLDHRIQLSNGVKVWDYFLVKQEKTMSIE